MDQATKPDTVKDHVSNLARSTNELLHTLKHDGYEAAHESLLKETATNGKSIGQLPKQQKLSLAKICSRTPHSGVWS